MPTASAWRRFIGIARTIAARSPVTDTTAKITPAQNTMPSAVGHGTFWPSTIPKVKNALMPIPGATPKGSFA